MARSSLTDQRKADNQRKCGANRQLVFRGVVAKDEVDNLTGKDVIHLILLFSDELSFRLFDPRISVAKKNTMASTLGSLCEALGINWNDMPACFGWEDFATSFVKFMDEHRRKSVFAKVTLNSNHWPTLGTDNHLIPMGFKDGEVIYGYDRCFSMTNDLEYSDADMTYLDHSEGDLAHPAEQGRVTPPAKEDYEDLPF